MGKERKGGGTQLALRPDCFFGLALAYLAPDPSNPSNAPNGIQLAFLWIALPLLLASGV